MWSPRRPPDNRFPIGWIRGRSSTLGSDRPWFLVLLISLVAIEVVIPFARYPSIIGADWFTYRDGLDRLTAGMPLYDPRMLQGPYDYLAPDFAGLYNMPPWFLPLVVPVAMLPAPLDRLGWVAVIAVALLVAIAWAVPPRHRALTTALVLVSTPLWMTLAWGNAEALVILGLVIWVIGVRRDTNWLLVVGLLLVSVKVVTAIPLAIYMLHISKVRSLLMAAGIAVAITLALSLWTGRNVLADFVVAFGNIEPTADTNIAPSRFLLAFAPGIDAVVVVRIAAIVALVLLATAPMTLFDVAWMLLIVIALPVNVYSFWLLLPAIAALAAYRYGMPMAITERQT